ncbi:unnamed protein product, partial [marine sediment metagenome]
MRWLALPETNKAAPRLIHSWTPPLIHSWAPPSIHSWTPPLTHSWAPPLTHSWAPPSIHSWAPPWNQLPAIFATCLILVCFALANTAAQVPTSDPGSAPPDSSVTAFYLDPISGHSDEG